ncbi:MAG TPA: MopE-related protein [Candidatus Polarisedimenticolia bacterium]|nr:MopE-related protein [Candidatus Polarisedimenticolia bacterium]
MPRLLRRLAVPAAASLVLWCTPALPLPAGEHAVSLERRVEAQRAIERVYHRHRVGSARSFEEALPADLPSRKVARYLAQGDELSRRWNVTVTREALVREMARIRSNTMFPARLRAIERALGADEDLILETVARPVLTGRLMRRFEASQRGPAEGGTEREAGPAERPAVPAQETATAAPDTEGGSEALVPQNFWWGGRGDDLPAAMSSFVSVWTGSEMIVWGGSFFTNTGSRYDPLTDTWTAVEVNGAPDPRRDAAAVWTGSEMVVWGGVTRLGRTQTGGRYDPVADTWSPTSTVGAPPARSRHAAQWTGSEMIVWGGNSLSGDTATGGRYDPAANTWTPLSGVGAPSGRSHFVSVWTGSEMIVWGTPTSSTGGRYNPSTDSWAPTSLAGAPGVRTGPAAVWTGSEMIVWGGTGAGVVSTGARYNPTTDTWVPVSTAGAPSVRFDHTMVWTGQLAITWGGFSGTFPSSVLANGGRYDPATDTWTATSLTGAPGARREHAAVWTGDLMIVWGGSGNGLLRTGGRYDPAGDSWTPTSAAPDPAIPVERAYHAGVWTGSEMIVWGGEGSGPDGARYDPLLDDWNTLSTLNAPLSRSFPAGVWTGSEMIVWGGSDTEGVILHGTGGRYDPAADAWRATSSAGAPTARSEHTAVWTGSEMIVWGGDDGDLQATGGCYSPATDSWTPTSPSGAPVPRSSHSAVWTGSEMIVWGGVGGGISGGRYSPVSDSWTPTTEAGAPSPRFLHSAVWTGTEMIVWGSLSSNTGGRYDPLADTWVPTSTAGAPSSRVWAGVFWTGTEMFVWGGLHPVDFGARSLDDGGRYTAATNSWSPLSTVGAPGPRNLHTTAWTGSTMLVWGGEQWDFDVISWAENTRARWYGNRNAVVVDEDGDGYTPGEGDCDDTNPNVNPGAIERPGNLLDENCDGEVVCDPSIAWRSPGAYTSCVARACESLIAAGALTEEECRPLRYRSVVP